MPDTEPGTVPDNALVRIIAFKNAFARRQAHQVVEVPNGFAVLDPKYAASYDHNKLILATIDDPVAAIASAEEILGGADLAHRLVVVNDDQTGLTHAPSFIDAGYAHEASVYMLDIGGESDRPADSHVVVEPVALSDLHDADWQSWRTQLPNASDQEIAQLVDRRVTRLLGADDVTFLAVRNAEGDIVSHAELYIDSDQGIAQIESVMTAPEFRDRGYARAIMAEGRRRAQAAGSSLLFVEAAAQDWPRQLYHRLGYVVVGQTHSFTRPAPTH